MSAWLVANKSTLIAFLGTFCTLGIYSVLYKENKLYRLFEHIYLGLATGFLISQAWIQVLEPNWWTPLKRGEWWMIFGLIIGLFYYFIYSKKFAWLSRLVIGFFLGVTAGRVFQVFANDTWKQIISSFKPLIPHPASVGAGGKAIPALSGYDVANNLIFMVILVCVMSYFFFSFQQKNPVLKGASKLGRWMLMFTFGAIFGSTIMARLALLIDRMDFILNTFGPHVGGPIVSFAMLIGLSLVVLFLTHRDKKLNPNDSG